MKSKTSTSAVLPVLFGFFIMGLCDLVGVSVSYAKESFNWSDTQSNVLPTMVFFWFLVLSIPSAIVMDKIGRKNTVLIGMAFTFVGMLLPFIHFNEAMCLLTFALLGIGNTILQVSLNPLLTNVIKGNNLSSSLTTGQVIKAISSFLGPIIAGFCSTSLGNWTYMFLIYAGVTLLSTTWLILTSIDEDRNAVKHSSFGEIMKLLGNSKILLLFLGILCIVGLDVGMNTVTPKLLIERCGLSTESAGYGSSWYFAARTIGAFLGAILLTKVSNKVYFRVNMIIVLFAICGLFFVNAQYLIIALVCLTAFASSSIFAVIFSMAMESKPDKANEISGLMITGVAGGAIFPPLMGMMSDFIGNQNGAVFIIALTSLYLLFCAFGIKYTKRTE